MEIRRFGGTDLQVSVVGFGAWAIGGAVMAGATPIGWGPADDATSRRALQRALELGITFIDTADFYGLGHSEELVGEVVGPREDVVVATKVGHRIGPDGSIALDYSRAYIERACEESLRRLRRDRIDLYQLHSARVAHFEQGECLEAMDRLRAQGKIRWWGVSLNTFHPGAEAEYLLARGLGHGVQLVLNVINQRAVPLLQRLAAGGYGVIARMPLQFGLLTGKFARGAVFGAADHRSFRLTPAVLDAALGPLDTVREIADRHRMSPTALALSFCAGFPEVSTVIPGIRTPEQAEANAAATSALPPGPRAELEALYRERLEAVVGVMEQAG